MAFLFTDNDRFDDRNWYYIRLIVEAFYEPGGTRYVINNVAYKDSQPQNDNPFSSGSPRSYSVPNGRTGGVNGGLSFQSGSDSGWSFQFNAGTVPQTQNIWGAGSFTRWINDSDSAQSVTISASHSLLGSASATANIKHIFRTSFDYNGGSGSPSFTDAKDGDSISLPSATRSGYTLTGWSSGGTNYGTGSYTVDATRTLVAQWETAADPPNFVSGISNRTLYQGNSSNFGDYFYASNTYSALELDVPEGASNFTVETSNSNYDDYFGINESSVFGNNQQGWLTWDIPSDATPIENLTVTVKAHGPGGTDTDAASIDIRIALPTYTDTSLGDGRKGTSYSLSTSNDSISADSNTESWLISGTPTGMAYSVSGDKETVTFSGTPSVYGNQTITATARNSDNAGSARNISFTIEDVFPQWADQTLSNNVAVQGDTTYSDQVSVVSGPTTTYSVTPGESLPAGLELNTSTGALTANSSTGITAEPNTYTFRIRATNGTNESIDTNNLSLTVEPAGGFMKVWDGAAWVEAPAKVWVGSSWSEGTVKVWNGSAWVESFSS